MVNIQGSTFIVTGGASGLGEAVVRLLVSRGGNAVIFDVNEQMGSALERDVGKSSLFIKTDITQEDSVKNAITQAVRRFGSLQGAVQCAGIALARKVVGKNNEPHSLEEFKKILTVNVVGTFNVVRLVASQMASQPLPADSKERGVFVHTSSVASLEGQIGQVAYAASKGAVNAMTLPLAREFSQLSIRTATIAPGVFETPMMSSLPPKAAAALAQSVTFPKRLGRPQEFAELVASVLCNEYINGEIIRLDGSIRMAAM